MTHHPPKFPDPKTGYFHPLAADPDLPGRRISRCRVRRVAFGAQRFAVARLRQALGKAWRGGLGGDRHPPSINGVMILDGNYIGLPFNLQMVINDRMVMYYIINILGITLPIYGITNSTKF